jgi:hypothetical protein
MDEPKTRRESKKTSKEKRGDSIYSAKHVRQQEAMQEKRLKK